MIKESTVFSGCGHEVEKVIQDMVCPVCMRIELERLREALESIDHHADDASHVRAVARSVLEDDDE